MHISTSEDDGTLLGWPAGNLHAQAHSTNLWNWGADGHPSGQEEAEYRNVACRGRAARQRHEIVPEVGEAKHGARSPWKIPGGHCGQDILPQRRQLLEIISVSLLTRCSSRVDR